MEPTLVVAGIAFIGAAIAGGGLVAFKIEVPLIDSLARQVALGTFGAVLLLGGVWLGVGGHDALNSESPSAGTNLNTTTAASEPSTTTSTSVTVATAQSGSAPSITSLTWLHNPTTGHYYALTETGRSWEQLDVLAEEHGGYLASIADAEEEEWLFSRFGNTVFWIGLNDLDIEDEWAWTSGEPTTYLNWCPGEPTDVAAGVPEDAVHTIPWASCWNDEAVWAEEFLTVDGTFIPSYPGVIEIDGPPD